MKPRFRIVIALLPLSLLCACAEPGTDEGGDEAAEDAGETGDTGDTGETYVPTWHQDIAPLVNERCGNCHRPEGIAPFSLLDYDDAAQFSELALGAIESGEMPPWGQANTELCEPRHAFMDDPSFSEEELDLFAAWVDAGAPEGDPGSAAPIPPPPDLELDGADLRLTMPGEIALESGPDEFWCFVLDPGFEDTQFIDGVQVVPGNESIVHHVLIYVDESGQSDNLAGDDGRYECFGGPGISNPTLIGVWAPGVPAAQTPEQVAMSIAPGSKLIMNVHYHPTGEAEVDSETAIDLRFASGAPLYLGQLQLIGNLSGSLGGGMGLQPGPNDSGDAPEFRIPAGVEDHRETMLFRLPASVPELKIWSVGSHMHYVGTDMVIAIDRAEPEAGTGIDAECLLQTPKYDFEWQRGYRYDAPLDEVPTAQPGDILYMHCDYNNSMSNPYVVEALDEQGLDAPVDVYLGEETLDEMCLGVFGLAYSIAP